MPICSKSFGEKGGGEFARRLYRAEGKDAVGTLGAGVGPGGRI